MNNKSILFAAGIFLASMLTISCSTDDSGNEIPSSSSVISVSSSPSSSSLYSSSSFLSFSSSSQAVLYGILTDNRDGNTYKTVDVGTRIWMVENLNYDASDSYCYNNLESNCNKYGRLYERIPAQTVCPSGWHLPNDDELEEMEALIEDNRTLLNDYGFATNLGGFINPEGYYQNIGIGYWWSAYGNTSNHYRATPFFEIGYSYPTGYFFSVRCVANQSMPLNPLN